MIGKKNTSPRFLFIYLIDILKKKRCWLNLKIHSLNEDTIELYSFKEYQGNRALTPIYYFFIELTDQLDIGHWFLIR